MLLPDRCGLQVALFRNKAIEQAIPSCKDSMHYMDEEWTYFLINGLQLKQE